MDHRASGRALTTAVFLLAVVALTPEPAPGQPAGPAALTPETLGKFLEDMAEDPKPLGKEGDARYRYILERKREMDGWTWTLRPTVSVSPDGTKVWITASVGNLPNLEATPGLHLGNLLTVNNTTAPAFFSMDPGRDNLTFHLALENKGITARQFRSQFDQFLESYTKHHKSWNIDLWTFPGLRESYSNLTNWVKGLAVTPDGRLLAAVDWDGNILVREVGGSSPAKMLKGSKEGVLSVVLLPDGKTLIAGEEDGGLREWDIESGREKRRFEGHKHKIWTLALSKDGKRLASAGGSFEKDGKNVDRTGKPTDNPDLVIRIWDVESGKELQKLEGHKKFIQSVAFSPDGSKLISGSNDQTVRVWDVATGKQLHQSEALGAVINAVAFTPDGKGVSGGAGKKDGSGQYVHDQTIRVWDVNSGKQLKAFGGHHVWGVAVSADGKRVLTAGQDRTVRLWDLETGKEMKRLGGHRGSVERVLFTPDGKQALSGGDDNVVRLWDLTP
jgi:WD40 repeat protein